MFPGKVDPLEWRDNTVLDSDTSRTLPGGFSRRPVQRGVSAFGIGTQLNHKVPRREASFQRGAVNERCSLTFRSAVWANNLSGTFSCPAKDPEKWD